MKARSVLVSSPLAVARIFSAQGKPLTPEIVLKEGDPGGPAGDDGIHVTPYGLALAPDGTLSALVQDNGVSDLQSYLARVPPGGRSSSLQHLSEPSVPSV